VIAPAWTRDLAPPPPLVSGNCALGHNPHRVCFPPVLPTLSTLAFFLHVYAPLGLGGESGVSPSDFTIPSVYDFFFFFFFFLPSFLSLHLWGGMLSFAGWSLMSIPFLTSSPPPGTFLADSDVCSRTLLPVSPPSICLPLRPPSHSAW